MSADADTRREAAYERLKSRGRTVLDSSAAAKLQRFTGDLVLGLFARRGAFWNAVRDMRTRWGIEATRQVPPAINPGSFHYPEFIDPENDEHAVGIAAKWRGDLHFLQEKVVPEWHLKGIGSMQWRSFLSACVLYDPPVPGLPEFAALNDPTPHKGIAFFPNPQQLLGLKWSKIPSMVAPPIKSLQDPEEVKRTEKWFYERLIQEIGERYLKPLGLDIQDMRRNVLKNTPGLWEEYHKRQQQNPPRECIIPDEFTTKEDVGHGFDIIAAMWQDRPSGHRFKRDPLIAVECAILHDRHEWTYEQLANRYGWQDSSRASKYIKDGRDILQE